MGLIQKVLVAALAATGIIALVDASHLSPGMDTALAFAGLYLIHRNFVKENTNES